MSLPDRQVVPANPCVRTLLGACALLLAPACSPPEADLFVFAAASLQDACRSLESEFERSGGVTLDFHFASSNELCRQLIATGRGDVFLSADEFQMERLAGAAGILEGSRADLLSNQLVVVVPSDSPIESLTSVDLTGFERLSLADPRIVPAGRYARAWLEHEGLWKTLSERIVPAIDVRAALTMVASGAVPVGVVYATDAAPCERVRVVLRVEPGPVIRYPVAIVKHSRRPELAARFLEFLRSDAARAVFVEHGFVCLERP